MRGSSRKRRRASVAIPEIPPFPFLATPTRVFVKRQMVQACEFKKGQQGEVTDRPKFTTRSNNDLFTKVNFL